MAFDGLVLNGVVAELKENLIGGKIQKIYEPNPDEILFGIYANNLSYALTCNASSKFYSVYLTTTKKENPLVAPNFCMLLRKHLIGYKIANISTINKERILVMELAGNDDSHKPITKKIVVELMGKYSNILLLNENNIIIDSLKHFSVADGASRNILPKSEYTLPVSSKIDISKYQSIANKLNSSSSLSSFFAENFAGISKISITHAINYLNLDDSLTPKNYELLANYLLELQDAVLNNNAEAVEFDGDYVLEINKNAKKPMQINFFLDDYYTQKEQEDQFIAYRNQLLQFILAKLKKISKKLSNIDEKLKECQNLEKYKLYGELITSFLYQIPKDHTSHIELTNYYDNKLVDIPLDISLSPADNAKKYFKKYHKLKNTYTIVQEQKSETEKEINYLESIVYEIQASQSIKDLDEIYDEIQDSFSNKQKQKNKKSAKKAKSKKVNIAEPIKYNIDGFKVLVGKNNTQNDELTFKIASKEDIWFHTKDIHGSHVILVTNGVTSPQETINKCAGIAAYHSKAMQSSNVAVDYTLVKYVKKPKVSKHGMVIYTNQKTVIVKPLKIT